ncbi:unnamed protein product [Lactuca saligna]|uniref:Uncharacterized protein n=1 Tax=Lactuca saligna TaxID=75948 RepID=A0AA35YVB5_LACSI|nr:unnamed protein product [Lactuca saligna]
MSSESKNLLSASRPSFRVESPSVSCESEPTVNPKSIDIKLRTFVGETSVILERRALIVHRLSIPDRSQIGTPIPLSRLRSHAPLPLTFSFKTKETLDDSSTTGGPTSESLEIEIFEVRPSHVRLRNQSGKGKKVDPWKSMKSENKSDGSSGSGANMYLPLLPSKDLNSG